MALIKCDECGKGVSDKAKTCPNCGNPIDTSIRCPKCGSSNTRPISNTSKVMSTVMWGVFSAHKVISKYECLDCKHKF